MFTKQTVRSNVKWECQDSFYVSHAHIICAMDCTATYRMAVLRKWAMKNINSNLSKKKKNVQRITRDKNKKLTSSNYVSYKY